MKRLYSMFIVSAVAFTAIACVEPLLMTLDDSGDRWSAPGTWKPAARDGALLAAVHADAGSSAVARSLPALMDPAVATAWVLTTADAAWPGATLVSRTEFATATGTRVTEISIEAGDSPRHRHDFYLFPRSTRYIEVVTVTTDLERTRADRRALVEGFEPGAELVTRRSEDTARVGALSEVGLVLPQDATPEALRRTLVARKDGKSVTLTASSRLISGRVITYDLPYPTTRDDLARGLLEQARSRGETTEPADAWLATLVAREEAPSALSPMTHVHAILADGVRVHQLTLSTPSSLEAENLEPMLELVRALTPSAP